MTIRWYARSKDWPLEHVEVVVDHSKKLVAGTQVPVDTFEKTIFIRGPLLTGEQRTRLLDIASKCPVQRTLESTLSISAQFGSHDGEL